MEMIQYLQDLKDSHDKLEIFGEITTTKKSWFRFVKYDSNVHVEMIIENYKLEFFDTFKNANIKVDEFLKTAEISF